MQNKEYEEPLVRKHRASPNYQHSLQTTLKNTSNKRNFQPNWTIKTS